VHFTGAIPSIIIRGSISKRNVEFSGLLQYHDRIFPNPATSSVNIASVESATPFHIIDMFGRTVLNGVVGDHTTIPVDVSRLSRGAYYVIVDNTSGNPITVGKMMLVW
jgi:hypothetical protein